VYYFKYQKRKHGIEYAREHRLLKMAPLHHHYQKSGFHESKIVMRFFIVGIALAALTVITLKLR
jgi:phospho-N-acetylmuramoyl-pentapeptide-transferase